MCAPRDQRKSGDNQRQQAELDAELADGATPSDKSRVCAVLVLPRGNGKSGPCVKSAHIGAGALRVRALIVVARSSRASARCTIGISIILPSIANEPRQSAAACRSSFTMRSASVTSCSDGLKPALRIGTSDGWMQAEPTKPKSAERLTMRV